MLDVVNIKYSGLGTGRGSAGVVECQSGDNIGQKTRRTVTRQHKSGYYNTNTEEYFYKLHSETS